MSDPCVTWRLLIPMPSTIESSFELEGSVSISCCAACGLSLWKRQMMRAVVRVLFPFSS